MECKACRSKNIVEDDTRQEMFCDDCGVICEIADLECETEFHETANGSKVPVGCLISTGCPAAKQLTVRKAKERLNFLCNKLFLEPYVASYALEIFKSAFMRGLTKGRGSLIVAGACLYLASRIKRQSIMLLDISDKINVNVYTLGKAYTVIKESFGQKLPDIDPCLFIDRFASRLEFSDKTGAVSITALKLLQRMKKDWISTGRRPSGVTATALLISARIHGFDRNCEDVAKIAGVSKETCLKRLDEWSRTATANLTLSEFNTIDLEEECDPPAFTEQNLKDKFLAQEMTNEQILKIKEDILKMRNQIEEETNDKEKNVEENFSQLILSIEEGEIPIDILLGEIEDNESDIEEEINGRRNLLSECLKLKEVRDLFTNFSKSEISVTNPVTKFDELPLVIPVKDVATLYPIDNNIDELDMTGIDDEDLKSSYILSHEESVKKLRWFYKTNKDYYRSRKATQARKAEKLKKIEGSTKKPRSKRPKRGAEYMVNPDELIQSIEPSIDCPETKIQKLSPSKDNDHESVQSAANSICKFERDYPSGDNQSTENEIGIPEINDNYDGDEW